MAEIDKETFDFIVVNFANCDMVGHTGVYSAIQKAVATIDDCVRDVVEAAKRHGYDTIIIADHGNADHALNDDGTPNRPIRSILCRSSTSRTTKAKVKDGRLADVAPSVLHVMGLPQPSDMTGTNLIAD